MRRTEDGITPSLFWSFAIPADGYLDLRDASFYFLSLWILCHLAARGVTRAGRSAYPEQRWGGCLQSTGRRGTKGQKRAHRARPRPLARGQQRSPRYPPRRPPCAQPARPCAGRALGWGRGGRGRSRGGAAHCRWPRTPASCSPHLSSCGRPRAHRGPVGLRHRRAPGCAPGAAGRGAWRNGGEGKRGKTEVPPGRESGAGVTLESVRIKMPVTEGLP